MDDDERGRLAVYALVVLLGFLDAVLGDLAEFVVGVAGLIQPAGGAMRSLTSARLFIVRIRWVEPSPCSNAESRRTGC